MQNALAPNLMTENVADTVRYYLCALLGQMIETQES